ncbi:hypothetical protein BS78_03G233800 [Paspalum vaginatum]|nr:hypothetical protein BS78_03G233800 [Paspalum vaginatum]
MAVDDDDVFSRLAALAAACTSLVRFGRAGIASEHLLDAHATTCFHQAWLQVQKSKRWRKSQLQAHNSVLPRAKNLLKT